MVWFAPKESLPFIVTPVATARLLKLPNGALSNVISDPPPSPATAASKEAAAVAELGCGLPVVGMMSSPEKVMSAADAGTADPNIRKIAPNMLLFDNIDLCLPRPDVASPQPARAVFVRSGLPVGFIDRISNFWAKKPNQ